MLTADMLASIALALLTAASALDPYLNFHYVKYPLIFRRNEVACQVCYGEFDCLSMSEPCGYNAAISQVLEEHNPMKTVNDGLKTKVDSMMYDLVLEDSLEEYKECIPFISSYTTCSKENTCLGCKSCDCDELGRWNCSETSKCSTLALNVDHGVLASVIAGLKDANPSRLKRSNYATEARSIYEDIMNWIEVSTPTDVQVKINNTSTSTTIDTTTAAIKDIASDDNNNLGFDDILSNDNLEHFIKYSEQDNFNDDKNYENNDSYQFLKILRNFEEGRDDIAQIDNPNQQINLIQSLKKYIEQKSPINEPSNCQSNDINTILTDTEDIDVDKQPSDIDSVALVVKRNVRDVNETSIQNQTNDNSMTPSFDSGSKSVTYSHLEKDENTKNVTYSHLEKDNGSKNVTNSHLETDNGIKNVIYSHLETDNGIKNVIYSQLEKDKGIENVSYSHLEKDNESINVTYSEKEIQHLIDIVTVLIGNERKEINHLIYVKDSLLKLIRKYQMNYNGTDVISNQTTDNNSRNHGNWKDDILKFYTKNLKRDVKDTLRDIYAIQKLKKLGVDSVAESGSNLKPLLFALTSYYLKNFRDHQQTEYKGKYSNSSYTQRTHTNTLSPLINTTPITNTSSVNQINNSEPKPQRRAFQPLRNTFYPSKLIKQALTRMLLMIDNEMSSTSAFSPLSAKTKIIFKRIVDKQYAKHFSDIHPSIRDPNFNLTKILTSLAELWEHIPSQLRERKPADQLYNMKFLHLTLSQGIDKLKDALVSVQFGYSRRMTFIEEYVGKVLIADIARRLATLDNHIINYAVTKDIETPKTKGDQTESVWNHIKTALSNSKNNLIKYFHGKFKPKSYIVNENVRKRAEEVNKLKFLEVMKRWQKKIYTYRARNKRSVQHYTKRMKNIIPKYLRGIKGNPVLKGNQKNGIKPDIKAAPVTYKAPTQSKKGVGVKRYPSTRPPTKLAIKASRNPVVKAPKNSAVKALPRHTMETQKSHRPVLARGGQKPFKGSVIHQAASGSLQGHSKRGVRSKQQH